MKNFDLGILFARLGLGVCFFMHGFAKILHGIGGVKSILTKAGLPEVIAYGSYVGEVIHTSQPDPVLPYHVYPS